MANRKEIFIISSTFLVNRPRASTNLHVRKVNSCETDQRTETRHADKATQCCGNSLRQQAEVGERQRT